MSTKTRIPHRVGNGAGPWALTAVIAGAGLVLLAPDSHAQDGRAAAWDSVAAAIGRMADRERSASDVAGVWWAVADGRGVVRVGASGRAARDSTRAATVDDRVRVGSVTKTITALALMRRWERGGIELDAPIDRLLPLVAPTNPFAGNITLRMLLQHRSGVVRETPVGHLFDTTGISLERAVASLRHTRLVSAPGSRFKYSNAGAAIAGRALEVVSGRDYATSVRDEVLAPLDMMSSGFDDAAGAPRATGDGWKLGGPSEAASRVTLGLAPAAGLRTTVRDFSRLLLLLARGGQFATGAPFLKPSTFADMTTIVETTPGTPSGTGLGFFVDAFGGSRRLWHDGLSPGFTASLLVAPDDSVAVLVVANTSAQLTTTRRLAQGALRMASAAHALAPVFDAPDPAVVPASSAPLDATRDLPPAPADDALRPLLGLYENGLLPILVTEERGRLLLRLPARLATHVERAGDTLRLAAVFDGEALIAERDARGRVVALSLNGTRFARHPLGPESGNQLRVAPVRPMRELRREALAAAPPVESGRDAPVDLVELRTLDPSIKLEVRYATSNNLYGTPFYSQARAFLQRPAAQALVRASARLRPYGVGLLVHDGYRPWYVTRMFWDGASVAVRPFVADPSKGSKHNRGAAVDLALYDLVTGTTVPMPSTYDETTIRAYPDFPGGTARERWARDLLRRAMETEGFTVYEYEWWHFDFTGWQHWPILNVPFERLGDRRRAASGPTPQPPSR